MQVPEFTIETVETLDSEGRLLRPLPGALREREQLIDLYQIMVLTRVFDREAINLQRTGAMGTYPSCEGQEAIGAGIGVAMRKDDVFVTNAVKNIGINHRISRCAYPSLPNPAMRSVSPTPLSIAQRVAPW